MKKSLSILSLLFGLFLCVTVFCACGGDDSDGSGSGGSGSGSGGASSEQITYESGTFDFSAKNSDGITIYYNILNAEEAEVTYARTSNSGYLGYEKVRNIRIPATVINSNNNRTLRVTRIGKHAFDTYVELPESITIPNSITSIGDCGLGFAEKIIILDIAAWCNIEFESPRIYSWYIYSNDNTEITSLTIPSGVTTISDYAFHGCWNISEISLPSSLEKIGNEAFSGCPITSITIPKSVKEIGYGAFNSFDTESHITTVTSLMEEPIPFIKSDNIFNDITYKNATLYVPKGTLSKYQNTLGWKQFLYIEEM